MAMLIGYKTLRAGLEKLGQFVAKKQERGEKVLIFCEDRMTYLAERAVCRAVGGTFDTVITTFARFLKAEGKILSKHGSVLAVGRIIRENSENLRCFSSASGARFGAAVYEMLSQLFASKVSAAMLADERVQDDLLREKLADLSRIATAYEKFLDDNGYVDENRYLSYLPASIADYAQIGQTHVVFFGFSSFTAQAQDGLRSAFGRAKSVLGLLPSDKAEICANDAFSAFSAVAEEYGGAEIYSLQRADGVGARLAEGLFDPSVFRSEMRSCEKKIFLAEARDEEAELRTVCADIRRYVRGGGRYADIAVFFSDAKKYLPLFSSVFGEYDVPYYADVRRSLERHPFACFLLSFLRAVQDGCMPESVSAVLASPYFGDDGEYRNYLSKFCNYRGGVRREIKPSDALQDFYGTEGAELEEKRAYLEEMRRRFLDWYERFPRSATGGKFISAIRELCVQADYRNITQKIVDCCSDTQQKRYLERLTESLNGLLNEAEVLLGDAVMTVGDLLPLLQNGLSCCEVALLPLLSDGVFVGDISSSAVERAAVVYCVGMTDEVPYCATDTAILSERDIGKLKKINVKIEPSVAQVNMRTRENVCRNVCCFEDRLVLLRPTHTEEKRSESDILRYVRRIFSDVETLDDLFIDRCGAPTPAMKEYFRLRSDLNAGLESAEGRGKYSDLYQVLSGEERTADEIARLEGIGTKPLFVAEGEKLFFSGGKISPTLLERYASCPYANFLERGLRLKPREESSMLATDTGNFVHEIMEKTANRVEEFSTKEDCRQFAVALAEELLQTPVYASLTDTKAGEYSARRLTQDCGTIASTMYEQIVGSDFSVLRTEYSCSLEKERIFGRIDRVDQCGDYVRIVDYKTGHIDTDTASYYTGLKLQLQLYMSAVCDKEQKKAGGIYYFPAVVQYGTVENPMALDGFMTNDPFVVKSSDRALEGKNSPYFSFSFRSDNRKYIDKEDFEPFIRYSLAIARQTSAELKRGFIAPTPYGERRCDYCAYKGMCASMDGVVKRPAEKIEVREIADIVRGEEKDD